MNLGENPDARGGICEGRNMIISDTVSLSSSETLREFKRWISAELLTSQRRWVATECRCQKRKQIAVVADVLTTWVHVHPADQIARSQLFNIMRSAVGEFIALRAVSAKSV